jgi:hypothetical protein
MRRAVSAGASRASRGRDDQIHHCACSHQHPGHDGGGPGGSTVQSGRAAVCMRCDAASAWRATPRRPHLQAQAGEDIVFTKQQLARHATGGGSLYLAILGEVFDVSSKRETYGGQPAAWPMHLRSTLDGAAPACTYLPSLETGARAASRWWQRSLAPAVLAPGALLVAAACRAGQQLPPFRGRGRLPGVHHRSASDPGSSPGRGLPAMGMGGGQPAAPTNMAPTTPGTHNIRHPQTTAPTTHGTHKHAPAGDFQGDLSDEVADFDAKQCLGLVEWLAFYHKVCWRWERLSGLWGTGGASTRQPSPGPPAGACCTCGCGLVEAAQPGSTPPDVSPADDAVAPDHCLAGQGHTHTARERVKPPPEPPAHVWEAST